MAGLGRTEFTANAFESNDLFRDFGIADVLA
jgi:hypothetical protein